MGERPHSECDNLMRSIQNYHMDTQGWSDIAYNLACCPHGYIFEGRGRGKGSGANGTSDANHNYPSVCALVGENDPQPAELDTAIADACTMLRSWGVGAVVKGHRDFVSTACPGNSIYKKVQAGRYSNDEQEDFLMGLSQAQQDDLKADTEWTQKRVAGMLPQRWFTVDDKGVARSVPEGTDGAKPASALDTLDGNSIQNAISKVADQVAALADQVAKLQRGGHDGQH